MDDPTPSGALGALLEDNPGTIGAVLGTRDGDLRGVIGSAPHAEAAAATVAVLLSELSTLGSLLGLGDIGVASLKSPSAGHVFARQGAAVLAVEVDPKRPVAGLEAKLRTTAWAPSDDAPAPVMQRAPRPAGVLACNRHRPDPAVARHDHQRRFAARARPARALSVAPRTVRRPAQAARRAADRVLRRDHDRRRAHLARAVRARRGR